MSRILKLAGWLAAAIAVLVAFVIAYIAATFDPNDYKPHLVRAVQEKLQRTLHLDGDIRLSFWPDIGAATGKASLSERASDVEFAAADDLRLVLKLMPLLRRQVVIDAIEATNLRARLIRYQDGATNIDDLIGARGVPAPPADEDGVAVDIRRVTIRNATIAYIDERAGSAYSISKLDLDTGRLASGMPSQIESSLVLQSQQPSLDLHVELKTTLTFDLARRHLTLAAADLNATGAAAGIDGLVASASGDVDADFQSGNFSILNLAAAARGKQDAAQLEATLATPRLERAGANWSGQGITLAVVRSEPRSKLVARLDIPRLERDAESFAAAQVNASVDLKQGGATTRLKLTGPLAASTKSRRIELSRLVANVHVDDSALLRRPIDARVSGAAQVDFARQSADLTFNTRIDDSNISGKAGISRFERPLYTFDISIDQVNADRYLPEKRKEPEPFDLSGLRNLNVSGSVRIGILTVANVKASNVHFDVKPAGPRGRVDSRPSPLLAAWLPAAGAAPTLARDLPGRVVQR